MSDHVSKRGATCGGEKKIMRCTVHGSANKHELFSKREL